MINDCDVSEQFTRCIQAQAWAIWHRFEGRCGRRGDCNDWSGFPEIDFIMALIFTLVFLQLDLMLLPEGIGGWEGVPVGSVALGLW